MKNGKITLGIWSIRVFKSSAFFPDQPCESEFNKPTLQAEDISDVPAEFVADPFITFHDSQYYMFFEVFNKKSERGEIGLATSFDGEKWTYKKIVLREKYHLSYPHVFKFGKEIFLIPESKEANGVFLYKAKNFPYEWEKVSKLISGTYIDPTIFRHKNRWWMFAGSSENTDLHLFYSDKIDGIWIEHLKNPIVSNNYKVSRPAGRVVENEGEIYRFTQDCFTSYGKLVRSFKIKKISETEYDEEEVKIILSSSNKEFDWRKDGMHHIDQLKINKNQWLIAVDGQIFEYKSIIRWKLERFLRNPVSSTNRLIKRYLGFWGGFQKEE